MEDEDENTRQDFIEEGFERDPGPHRIVAPDDEKNIPTGLDGTATCLISRQLLLYPVLAMASSYCDRTTFSLKIIHCFFRFTKISTIKYLNYPFDCKSMQGILSLPNNLASDGLVF